MATVIVVGMADSIHIARWLAQFKEEPVTIYFVPSRRFRKLSPELYKTIKLNENVKFAGISRLHIFSGYIDYILLDVLGKLIGRNFRAMHLERILAKHSVDLLHAIEIQAAGYLVSEIAHKVDPSTKIMLTNWGSDIFFYQNSSVHLRRIKRILSQVHFYSAECVRDYQLARSFGFQGIELPIIPNAGGFELISATTPRASERNMVLVKGTGGTFGNILFLIPILEEALTIFPHINVTFYSVTDDVLTEITQLGERFPKRVVNHSIKSKLDHSQMLGLFRQARVYLSSSKSDGISTSFLEALVSGSYPIQSDTSCAADWMAKGFVGQSIPNSIQEFRSALVSALESDQLVDEAQVINHKLSFKYLEVAEISKVARNFYDLEFLHNEEVKSERLN